MSAILSVVSAALGTACYFDGMGHATRVWHRAATLALSTIFFGAALCFACL